MANMSARFQRRRRIPGLSRGAGAAAFAIVLVGGMTTATRGQDKGVGATAATENPPRVASRSNSVPKIPKIVGAQSADSAASAEEPVTRAKRMIGECKVKMDAVQDYTCTFHKRERISGRLTSPHVMAFKSRTAPTSFYFKFQRPKTGREAIYVAGRNGGKVLAHDVGLGKFLAGTLRLDPLGGMAMEDNRHPINEAGLANLIDSVHRHWNAELTPEESILHFHPSMQVGPRVCTMIESIHSQKQPQFLFHMVRLYIDKEQGLPIRMEAYDWPKTAGAAPELVEEYTYLDLKLNVGLTDADFDPSNMAYAFGRF